MNITICGYTQEEKCEHCGRALKHVVITDTHGRIGTSCFVKLVKTDKTRYSNKGKPSTSWIKDLAKFAMKSESYQMRCGIMPSHFTFELA